MNGFAASRRRGTGVVAAALERAGGFLLDAPTAGDRAAAVGTVAVPPASAPLVIAVVPLARRCGGTTVARGLGALLALRAAPAAALVCGASDSVALALATPAATRLARGMAEVLEEQPRVSGRLCLVDTDPRIARAQAIRRDAPLILDLRHGTDPSEATALADVTVLVAAADTEPALAAVVGASLARSGPEPLLVVNRALEDDDWVGRGVLRLSDSRLASRIALAGREPPGALGGALSNVLDRCVEATR